VNYDKHLPLLFRRKSHNYSLDRQTKPLVLASEITGLSNLTGYLKSENYVVRFRFTPNAMRKRQPALIPRPVNPKDWPQRPTPAAPSSNADPDLPQVTDPAHGHRSRAATHHDIPQRGRPDPAVEHEPYFE
jgi:hypothetical protein